MIRFLLLHIFLARRCFCQLRKCYDITGGLVLDLPCDPSATVSACCGQDYTCSTNFYCTDKNGFQLIGTCTDKTWQDSACPLPLNRGDNAFNYTQNTTACGDGTFCMNALNTTCCFNHQGVSQIVYHYKAPLPTTAPGLSEFYAANGYQIANITSSSSDTLSPKASETTASLSTSAIASQTKPTTLPSNSATGIGQPTQHTASPALNPNAKAGIGVGVTVGVSLTGLLLYFLVRRLRRPFRRDMAHAGTSIKAPLSSRRYEKPELPGDDARKEMDAAETRKAELPGEETRMEMEATPGGR